MYHTVLLFTAQYDTHTKMKKQEERQRHQRSESGSQKYWTSKNEKLKKKSFSYSLYLLCIWLTADNKQLKYVFFLNCHWPNMFWAEWCICFTAAGTIYCLVFSFLNFILRNCLNQNKAFLEWIHVTVHRSFWSLMQIRVNVLNISSIHPLSVSTYFFSGHWCPYTANTVRGSGYTQDKQPFALI